MRILITCGPTREAIDPVRYLSNHSTGIMGFEMAKSFTKKGHQVTMLHGPVKPPALPGVKKIPFETALELKKLLNQHIDGNQVLIMAAAVSDYRPVKVSHKKLKKAEGTPRLMLKKNPDLLKGLKNKKKNKFFIGFCVESEKVVENAKQKLISKALDIIVAQKASLKETPFGQVSPEVWIVESSLRVTHHNKISKSALANKLEGMVRRYLPTS